MKEIFYNIMSHLPEVSQGYVERMADISLVAKEMREELLGNGIFELPSLASTPISEYSLCAIDGASGIEKLQSGDLMIAAATLAEGLRSKPIYGQGINSDKPYSSFAMADIHTSKNEQILSGMRAYTEICVLGETTHDISIIDGSYLGNFLTVLYQLQTSPETATVLLEYMSKDDGESFKKGLDRIFDVKKQAKKGKYTIALAKSDSSREMVKRYFKNKNVKNKNFFTDKMLAEYILQPGEMLMPAPVSSNIMKSNLLVENDGTWSGFKWNPKTHTDYRLIRKFFSSNRGLEGGLCSEYQELFELESYRYLYFKPVNSSRGSNPLRVEFTVDSTNESKVLEQAKFVTSLVNADMVSPVSKEPHCQYMVDREVKDPVSRALRVYRSELVKKMGEHDLHIEGVATNYRT